MSIEKERWNEEEVRKVAKIILKAEKNKSPRLKLLEQIVHWLILLIVLFGNVILDGLIIVLSGMISISLFYFIVILLGLGFGFILEVPIKDIEKIDKKKHFVSRLMLPVLALVNIYVLVGMKNIIEFFSGLTFPFNPLIIGLVYGTFLLIPHYSYWFLRK